MDQISKSFSKPLSELQPTVTVNRKERNSNTVYSNSNLLRDKDVDQEFEVLDKPQAQGEHIAALVENGNSVAWYVWLVRRNGFEVVNRAALLTVEARDRGIIRTAPQHYFRGILKQWGKEVSYGRKEKAE